MQEADDIVVTNVPHAEAEGVGAMLRARRLELGLSQSDVATQVKLPARRIEAMEQERWDELPDGPYLRGFLRNVARALSLDPALLMARVDASVTRVDSPPVILVPQGATHATLPRRSGPADDRRGGRTLVVGAFAFALVAALIAWSGTPSFDRLVQFARGSVAPSGNVAAAAPEPVAPEPVTETAAPAISATPAETVAPPVVPPAQSETAFALLFHFNEESWVEVRSADGKVLTKQLNAAGSEMSVDGALPYSLVVGNAKGVALRFRGQPVDLVPYTRDSVARLTLS